MNSTECYADLKKYREEAWKKVLEKKISQDDFVYTSFNYIQQKRYKPFVKAHDRESILFNYIYWVIQIERKILIEKQLIEQELGDMDLFNKVMFMHIKRRDQMVRRILTEKKEKIKRANIVFSDTVEIVLETNDVLYTSLENLEKLEIKEIEQKGSVQTYYTKLLKF
jgi:hypothetical protein